LRGECSPPWPSLRQTKKGEDTARRAATKHEIAAKEHKDRKGNKQHKFLSMCSLRSLVAKVLLKKTKFIGMTLQRGLSSLQPLAAPSCPAKAKQRRKRPGEGGPSFSPLPFPAAKISKNRRAGAAHIPHYHVFVGMQNIFLQLNSPQTTPNTQNWDRGRISANSFRRVRRIVRFSFLVVAHFSGGFTTDFADFTDGRPGASYLCHRRKTFQWVPADIYSRPDYL
jgi:hypothetical protein